MEMTEALNFIANNGFAVVVAIYSLTRLERTMSRNTSVMEALIRKIGGEQ
jgi:hypothetical protein